jgi:hypothetical protein
MLKTNDRVKVIAAINFGGGQSPWQDKLGTVRQALRSSRAVLVQLDGVSGEPFMFFLRELTLLDSHDRVQP